MGAVGLIGEEPSNATGNTIDGGEVTALTSNTFPDPIENRPHNMALQYYLALQSTISPPSGSGDPQIVANTGRLDVLEPQVSDHETRITNLESITGVD